MANDNPPLPLALPAPTQNHDAPQIIHKVKDVDPQARVLEVQRRVAEARGVGAGLDGEARVAGGDEGGEEGRVEGGGDEGREGGGRADGYEAVAGKGGRGRRGEGEGGVGEGFGEGCGVGGGGRRGHGCGVPWGLGTGLWSVGRWDVMGCVVGLGVDGR